MSSPPKFELAAPETPRPLTLLGSLGLCLGPFCLLAFPLLLWLERSAASDPRWGPYAMVGRATSIPLVGLALFCLVAGVVGTLITLIRFHRALGVSRWLWVATVLLPFPFAKLSVAAAVAAHDANLRRSGLGPWAPDHVPGDVPTDIHGTLSCGDILASVMHYDEAARHAWHANAWGAGSRFRLAMEGRRGGDLSLAIHNGSPNDARWLQRVWVAPHTDYVLTGWIRTEQVTPSKEPVQLGAHLSLLNRPEHSEPLFGTQGWTHATVRFNSGSDTSVVVACRLGTHSGTVMGKAWFDDLSLEPDIKPRATSPKVLE